MGYTTTAISGPAAQIMMLLLWMSLMWLHTTDVEGFSIPKGGIPGIWKLYLCDHALLQQRGELEAFRAKLLSGVLDDDDDGDGGDNDSYTTREQQQQAEILIKLNPDGSFRQCSEGYVEGFWISGRWELTKDSYGSKKKLLLALDRQYYGPRHDTLLEGMIRSSSNNDNEQGVVEEQVDSLLFPQDGNNAGDTLSPSSGTQLAAIGSVFTGKFMYPKHHPCFFDDPIAASLKNRSGSFRMEQALSVFSVGPSFLSTTKQQSENTTLAIQQADFYGRSFYMTVEPLKERREQQQRGDDSKRIRDNEQPVDIRAMPIQFFANNTFQAHATNKILRGRFGTQVSKDHGNNVTELWFLVNLFGAGRSAPGSVYSEGIGLTHEDKRFYVGEIVEIPPPSEKGRAKFFVRGSVTYGSDMGTDARPEPVGQFQLTEMTNDDDAVLDDDSLLAEDQEEGQGSVFE